MFRYLPAMLSLTFLLYSCDDKFQVTVHNTMTHTTIGAVYLMADTSDTLVNLLTYSLTPGLSETIDMPGGEYLLKIIDSEAREYSISGFVPQSRDNVFVTAQLCDSFPTAVELFDGMYAAGSGSSIVHVENNLNSEDILFLKMRDTGFENAWGNDLLGDYILHPGELIMLKTDLPVADILAEGNNIYLMQYFEPMIDENWIISEKYRNKMTYFCGSGDSELVIINRIPDFTGVYFAITEPNGTVETVDFESGFFRMNDQILVRLEPGNYDIFIEGTAGRIELDDIDTHAVGDTILLERNLIKNM